MNAILEEAIKEAYASAKQDTTILYTMEIHHKSITTPIRIVRWPSVGKELAEFRMKLESDAPKDAGQTVIFFGVPFELSLPEKSQDTPGAFEVTIPCAGPVIEQYLENAAMDGGPITATFRTYIQGREDEGPVERWPDIYMHSPTVDASTGNISIEGSVLDWLNRKFGRLIRPGNYPALVGR